MKLATQFKKTPGYPPGAHQGTHQGSDQADEWEEIHDTGAPFFSLQRKAAGITRKQLAIDLGWSKTYIDGILSGEKNDPVEQARKFCLMLRKLGRMDLVASTIVYIAGGDDFDGRVLTAVQVEALRELAKVVQR